MDTIPIYSLVAYSGTGKTTLLEKLVPILKASGLRVAVVKHDAHEFEIDREGKDSWRMTKAGADVTAVASATHAAILENRPIIMEELLRRIVNVDVILTEGYKHGPWPKIALLRVAAGRGFPVAPGACFALMTDIPLETSRPCLDLNDAEGLAVLILEDMKKKQ